ncbi:YtpR family tRNA-binding protein [Ligilactobacillus sp. Marseille-Q7487]|jgi:tRNA-binding protein|uniref:YtpR family tRNA-binding protein n=1 Tax=Ligilactobacillus sp. Marseille-Q7487 TaxID=3022128 RepID=UPI0015B57752|nr:DUF4479 and tRNA-binding domain-containing protein [Ligilactobacillus sp. Marseille-Q7487]
MLIASYNPAQTGDVLVVILAADSASQDFETKGNVTRIFDTQTQQTLGYNFFDISQIVSDLNGVGQVFLQEKAVAKLNQTLQQVGFKAELMVDDTPKFVVGFVQELIEHPDSDHLHIAQVQIDNGQVVQIVCGAPNIELNQRVVVAKPGAMMPNGTLIWPGELRGIASAGMICSARELALPNAPQKRGILVLPTDYEIGVAFDFQKASRLFVTGD